MVRSSSVLLSYVSIQFPLGLVWHILQSQPTYADTVKFTMYKNENMSWRIWSDRFQCFIEVHIKLIAAFRAEHPKPCNVWLRKAPNEIFLPRVYKEKYDLIQQHTTFSWLSAMRTASILIAESLAADELGSDVSQRFRGGKIVERSPYWVVPFSRTLCKPWNPVTATYVRARVP